MGTRKRKTELIEVQRRGFAAGRPFHYGEFWQACGKPVARPGRKTSTPECTHAEGLSLAGYDAGTIYQLRSLIPLLIATFPRGI